MNCNDKVAADAFTEAVEALLASFPGSMEKFAHSLEVNKSTVYRWKQGRTLPYPRQAKTLDSLATANGLRLERSFTELCRVLRSKEHSDPSASSRAVDNAAVSSVDIDKVAAYRWERLSTSERRALWEEFCLLRAEVRIPQWPLVSAAVQRELQRRAPLDLKPLWQLCRSMAIEEDSFVLPQSSESYRRMLAARDALIAAVFEASERGFADEQSAALRDLFRYLKVGEREITLERQATIDVVLVFGARQTHGLRVQKAWEIVRNSINSPLLVLCGQRPRWHDSSQRPEISEAEAMHYYLLEVLGADMPDERLVLESRPRSLRETMVLAEPVVRTESARRNRPLNIAMVGGAFMMRRIWMLLRTTIGEDKISGHSTWAAPLMQLENFGSFLEHTRDRIERRHHVSVYVSEFVKLIGGRAVGEF